MKLPEAYEKRMRAQLGEEEFRAYAESLDKPVQSAVRVNTLKLSPDEFEKIAPFRLNRVPWVKNGFWYNEDDVPSKHPYYFAGLYYLQEPSAMTPAALLPVNEGDKVLDLCAAPGGKSTELAAKLNGTGILISNDISNSRAKALLKNIELFGVTNASVISEAPNKLALKFPLYFDKILVDAPCSGEGMFRKQPAIRSNWEQYGTEYYNKLQKEILPYAYEMLKPGGMLLYSTCTFSAAEDEDTVRFLLDRYPDLELVDAIPEEQKEYFKSIGFSTGRSEWMENPLPEISKTVRLFPHKLDGEGHFAALLRKKDSGEGVMPVPEYTGFLKPSQVPKEVTEFLSHVSLPIDPARLQKLDERILYIPEGMPALNGFRVLRAGLLLGEVKKDRFEPSQALAMALSPDTYDNCVRLSVSDGRVVRYLKCESIECPEGKDGQVLICVGHFPLGFLKKKKEQYKNRYLPGWRLL